MFSSHWSAMTWYDWLLGVGIPAVVVLLVGLVAWRHLRWMGRAHVPVHDDAPTSEIPVVPTFGPAEKAIYRPDDYVAPLRCADPHCASPQLTVGQVFERIPDGARYLAVCLDCVDRYQQMHAGSME